MIRTLFAQPAFKALLALFLVAVIAVPVLLAALAIESTPLVEPARQLSHQDIERIKQRLRQHDPRHLKKHEVRTLSLTERDLNLLLRYAAPRTPKISSRLDLRTDGAQARLTVELPDNPLGDYLNISSEWSVDGNRLHVERLALGRLTLPGWLLEPLLTRKHRQLLASSDEYRMVVEAIRSYRFREDRLIVVYQLDPKLVEQLRQRGKGFLFPQSDTPRVLAYHGELARIADRQATQPVSLASVLPPLFQLAAARTAEGGEPQSENRTLLLVLALHALGMDISQYVDAPVGSHSERLHLDILGRHDLAQHYLVSAALTVSAGSGLADAMGVFKELDDSRGGSGFSFADLLADRAGIRLAGMATGTDKQARQLQQHMSGPLLESDFMPAIDDLPEGIMELEFKRRYRDPDSENYRLVEDEIERRLSRCKTYSPDAVD